jgi:hypothetical protein
MKKFSEIVKAFTSLNILEQRAIEWAIEHARETIQDPDYNEEDDDHTQYYFEEIGSFIYGALYPPEPEEEEPFQFLELSPGEVGFYCRKCRESHKFIERLGAFVCEKCGTPRIGVTTTIRK